MTELLFILENISLPILLLILVGFIFQKIFKMDVPTLTRLLIYLLIPVVVFVKIMDADVTWALMLAVTGYMLLLQMAVYIVGWITGRLMRQTPGMRSVTINAMVLINTGNYGIPLVDLTFGANPLATASQLFIVVIQNITTNTFGVFQLCKGRMPRKQAWLSVAKMPALYVLALAVLLKSCDAQIPSLVMIPLNYLSDSFIAVALLGLGAQLAEVKVGKGFSRAAIVGVIKSVTTPLLGFALVLLLGIKGILAQALVIGVSTPTAVSSAAMAREFDAEPGYAAQLVLVTTVLCTVTLPFIISFLKWFYA